jgi:hypothetical protein
MTNAEGLTAPPVLYERADYAALQKLTAPRALPLLMYAATILIILIFLLLLLLYLLTARVLWRETVVALGALVVLILLIGWIPGLKATLVMRAARNTGAELVQTFTIEDDFWRAESERGISKLRWSAVPRLEREPGMFFVFNGPRTAFIVPRRVFASDAEFEAFVAAVEERWKRVHRL